MPRGARRLAILSCLLAAGALGACSALPRDSYGALDRVRGGVLRVGVVEHPPWVRVGETGVSGREVELIQAWAAHLGGRVEWRPGDIEHLVDALHRREIDVLAGGLSRSTPYAPRLALSQPYATVEDARGRAQEIVLAVTPGESALLFALDQYLAARQ